MKASRAFAAALGMLLSLISSGATAGATTIATPAYDWAPVGAASPLNRYAAAMAYDPDRHVTLMFGGATVLGGTSQLDGVVLQGLNPTSSSDTWEFDGARWHRLRPATSPSPRSGAAMAYDTARHVMVLFGGAGNTQIFNDTWTWDGSTWTLMSPAAAPPVLLGAEMAYDSARQVAVMFGGDGDSSGAPTWEWDGSTWTQVSTPSSPSGRFNPLMVYDSAHGETMLFGGQDFNNTLLNDTWLWDGVSWRQQAPDTSPSPRSGAAMTYDSIRGRAVLFGGGFPTGTSVGFGPPETNEVWTWDGADWSPASAPAAGPPPRFGASLAFDGGHGILVLYGGIGQTYYGDTWIGVASPCSASLTVSTPPPVLTGLTASCGVG